MIRVLFVCFALLFPYHFSKADLIKSGDKIGEGWDISQNITVGFLKTSKETYPYEWEFSKNIPDMLLRFGVRVVLIDYNKIVDNDYVRAGVDGRDIEKRVHESLKAFVHQNRINRIFIPGNYYNLDSEPYPPTTNRQDVTAAIVKLVNEMPSIHLIAVCGGMQGVAHSVGVEVTRVSNILSSKEGVDMHSISMPDPHATVPHLHKMRVAPGSRLASITSEFSVPDSNGWLSFYFPDAHGGVINNSRENIEKLEAVGYKVVGFSDDGIIEAIEDKYGNIYFQDHPESLAINGDSVSDGDAHKKEREDSIKAAKAIINDFLYRS